jgi:hypothetical protein
MMLTEQQLQSMSYAQFTQWIEISKSEVQARLDHSIRNNESYAQSMLNRYQHWYHWFAGEITGYSSTTFTDKPCGIQFFATDDRQYSLNKAIVYAKTAYAERNGLPKKCDRSL